jgi:dihydrofolate reductase
MRRIIESTLVTLDGVHEHPEVWATPYFDSEAEAYALELLNQADAMLMGRRTYEFFAAAFPHRSGAYGDRINGIRKLVFSNTLPRVTWQNSVLVQGDPVVEIQRLKADSGKDLVVYGHGSLSRLLLDRGLLDQLKLWIHPIIHGDADPVLGTTGPTTLLLTSMRTLGSGVIVATYERAAEN